jgi:hypothetical protein
MMVVAVADWNKDLRFVTAMFSDLSSFYVAT